jgi:hypothetical protein
LPRTIPSTSEHREILAPSASSNKLLIVDSPILLDGVLMIRASASLLSG